MITHRPLYSSVTFCIKVLHFIQARLDKRYRAKQNRKYNLSFGGNSFFVHTIDNNLQIRLYKDSLLSKIIYDGFEKEEFDFVKKTLSFGDIFIDLGANIGLFSLLASKCVGRDGKVIAFEPAPVIYKRFMENVHLNKLENIDARNIGLSNEKGELKFYVSENGYDAWNSFAPSIDNKLQNQISVQVSTLDHELELLEMSKIKLVKIDVEGWEKFVLSGGTHFFKQYKPIVMVEFTDENTINAGYYASDIYDIMVSFGYEWYALKKGILIHEPKRIHYPYRNLIAIKQQNK